MGNQSKQNGKIKKRTFTHVLDFPVMSEGHEYTELTMRRPKVKDQLVLKHIDDDGEKEITLLANLCEVTPDVISELDFDDYAALQEGIQSFSSAKRGASA